MTRFVTFKVLLSLLGGVVYDETVCVRIFIKFSSFNILKIFRLNECYVFCLKTNELKRSQSFLMYFLKFLRFAVLGNYKFDVNCQTFFCKILDKIFISYL